MKTTATKRRLKEIIGKGWLDKDSGHTYPTASHAMRSVKRESKKNAMNGIGVVVVEWDTVTAIGAIIAKTMGSK
jgi:hypothetical protein